VEAPDTDQAAAALVEWVTYRDVPSGRTLACLQNALKGIGRIDALVSGLHRIFIETGQWKIAQHLALIFENQDYSVHAMYFAHKACILSGGDPLARLMLAKVVWMRRLPLAVLYETTIARLQARRTKDRRLRRLLQTTIADLNLKAHSYMKDEAGMRRYLRYLLHTPGGATDAVLQLLFGARSIGAEDLCQLAARTLAPMYEAFGGRAQGAIALGVRRAFLQLLGARL